MKAKQKTTECLRESISPADLERLAVNNPIVHACLTAWRCGDLSWDQALIHAVAALAKENGQLSEKIANLRQYEYPVDNSQRWLWANVRTMAASQIDALVEIATPLGRGLHPPQECSRCGTKVLAADRVTVRYGDAPIYDPQGPKPPCIP